MFASVAGSGLLIAVIVAAVCLVFDRTPRSRAGDAPGAAHGFVFASAIAIPPGSLFTPSPNAANPSAFAETAILNAASTPPLRPALLLGQISPPPATDTSLPPPPASTATRYVSFAFLVAAPIVLFALWFGDYIRPASIEKGGKRQLGEHPWFIWLFAGFVIFLTSALGASIAYQSPLNRGLGLSLREMAVPQLGMYAAGIFAAFVMLRLLRSGAPGAGLKFATSDLWKGAIALAAAFPVVSATGQISSFLHSRITGTPQAPISHKTLQVFADHPDDPWARVLMFCAIIGAPIVEESMYRACAQSAALKLTGRAWLSVVLATGVFTLSHWGAIPGHAFAPIAVLGLAMGIAFERTKSLGVPIVMHIGCNGVNVALAVML